MAALTQLDRLSQKHQEALAQCIQKISSWEKFKSDYLALDQRLSSLPDRTSYPIMMPVCGSNSAFVSARIQHTNEILVLLGDNYFVERSAKQAKEIVFRRVANCDRMLDKLKEEKKHIENWLSFTQQIKNEGGDFVEIVEEYDEEKERQWNEDHKRRIREYKQKIAGENQKTEDEYVKRLEELELEELESKNLNEVEQNVNLKSILKNSSKSEMRKSVSFDENEAAVIISDQSAQEQLNINPIEETAEENEDEVSTEAAFKNLIIEKPVEILPENPIQSTQTTTTNVSRFKASRKK